MRSSRLLITTIAYVSISMALTACETTGPPRSPQILLTAGDTTPSANPAKPGFAPLEPVLDVSAKAERDYLFRAVIDPLMDFSLAQEAAKQAEGQRADGLVAKIRSFNAAVEREKRRWWPFARDKP